MFGEVAQTAQETLAIGGWVGGIASVVLTLVTAYLSYRQNRARLEFDVDHAKLLSKLERLEAELEDAREAEQRCLDRCERLESELNQTRARLDQLYSHLADRGISPPPTP